MAEKKLSVVLATRNEEANIGRCLESVRGIADEIVVVDEGSTDKTREIARKFGAKVYKVKHEAIFHKTKEKALEIATGDWILQLDADEVVTNRLAKEIREVLRLSDSEIRERRPGDGRKWRLFQRHQRLIEQRDGKLGRSAGDVVAFFVPRRNYFLGGPLIHAGVYPDGQIRLVKRGNARFPAKSVHEQMEIEGEVAWLFNDLEHHDSPTLARYLQRMNRYTDLRAGEFKSRFKSKRSMPSLIYYSSIKPCTTFLNLYFRHLGFLDGVRGFLWSFFSAMHFPIAYWKYWQQKKV